MQRTLQKFGLICVLVLAHVSAPATSADTARLTDFDAIAHLLPPESSDPEIRRLYTQLAESLANQSVDEAEIAAKQLVELTQVSLPDDGLAQSRMLHNLAVIQHQAADFPAAIRNFLAAIERIGASENQLSHNLVPSLHALGLTYEQSGDPLAAIRTYDKALHINNVNDGPHSLSQVDLLGSIANLHDRQGDAVAAGDVLDRIHGLYARAFEPGSAELLPILYRQADFYRKHDMYRKEYDAWLEVLGIQRDLHGEGDLSLVEPQIHLGRNMIRGMNKVMYRSGPTAPSAEKYLRRALAIANSNPEADWTIRRKSLLALADYYMLLEMDAQGRRYYRDTWALLTEAGQFDQRAADLEANVPVSRPHPDPYANFKYNPDVEDIDPDDYRTGLMVAEFTINLRGRVQDVEIVESDPVGFERMEWRLRSALKDFVYRPMFVNGVAEVRRQFRYRLEYFYLPAEYEASLKRAGKSTRSRGAKSPRPPGF